jgi:hypothetical protein
MSAVKWPNGIPSPYQFESFGKLLSFKNVVAHTSGFKLGVLTDVRSEEWKREQEKKLDAFWIQVTSHDIYRWLNENQNFRRLWASFEKKAKGSGAGKLFGHRYARFWFLYVINRALLTFYMCQVFGHPPKQPTLQVKRRALKAVNMLLECEREWLRSWELTGDLDFEVTLKEMRAQLTSAIERHRKPMNDEDAIPRSAAENFTDLMILYFGDAPRAVSRY